MVFEIFEKNYVKSCLQYFLEEKFAFFEFPIRKIAVFFFGIMKNFAYMIETSLNFLQPATVLLKFFAHLLNEIQEICLLRNVSFNFSCAFSRKT